jgi:hypothetical protein
MDDGDRDGSLAGGEIGGDGEHSYIFWETLEPEAGRREPTSSIPHTS